MGLRMEDLHTPTVALGPTSTPAQNGATTRQSLLELMKQKDNVQAELSALGSVLESVRNIPPLLVSARHEQAYHENWQADSLLARRQYEHIPDDV